MIRQAPIDWDNIASFISSVGKEKVISIIPLKYDYTNDEIITYHGQKSESVGNLIVSKYLIIYDC